MYNGSPGIDKRDLNVLKLLIRKAHKEGPPFRERPMTTQKRQNRSAIRAMLP